MNRKGGATLIAIITAALIFMSGMLMVNFFKSDIDDFREKMGCNSANTNDAILSDGSKLVCLGSDLTIPYFIVAVISTAGGVILAKFAI